MRLLSYFLVLLVAGCAASSHVLVGKTRPSVSSESVKIYSAAPAKYEVIAIIESSSKNSIAITEQSNMNDAVQQLKNEAAKLGANGVLLQSIGNGRYGDKVASGSAIYVTQE